MELLGFCFTRRFSRRVAKRLPENFITKQGVAVRNWIALYGASRRGDSPRSAICEYEIVAVDLVRRILDWRRRPGRAGGNRFGFAIQSAANDACPCPDPGPSTRSNRA